MNIAIALFLKNENQNILSWLAWHLAIGVNKFFIYDDHSTDGTYEILKAACNIYNIELEQTNPKEITHFYWRQANAFEKACRKALNQNYDWIGFLDADEYVSLEKDLTIQDFLSRFPNYNGVSLNWRIYGNSNRVIKTKLPTYEAYNWHSNKDLGDMELTKCFIRPQDYSFEYINPHHFRTVPENYANSYGDPILEKRATSETIIWDIACINHYINRSMEDYVNRIKQRLNSDLVDSTVRWNHFNRNDIYHQERKDFIIKANKILLTLKKECVRHYIFNLTGFLQKNSNVSNEIKIYSLQTIANNYVGLNKQESFLCHSAETENIVKIFGVIYPEDSNHIYLFQNENESVSNVPFNIHHIERFSSTYQLLLSSINGTNYSSLQSPYTEKYASFLQIHNFENVEVNRDNCQEWEYIQLNSEALPINFNISPHSIHDVFSFYTYLHQHNENITYEDFILAYNLLTPGDQATLLQQEEGKIISWL